MSKYGVISGPYFPAFRLIRRDAPCLSVFSPNVGKYGPEITPYLDTFHAVKGTGIIKKLRNILPRNALLTIYKAFIRPNIDYCDFIYDRPHNESFCNNLEIFQYNATLAVTGATKGTSKLKIYEELCLESLKFRRWMHRLCVFYKIKTRVHPEYLYKLIPTKNSSYNTRNSDHINTYYCKTDIFKYSFFPYLTVEWNKLDHTLRNSKYYNISKNSLLKIGRPIPKPTFNIHNPMGLKLLTRLRLGLSHLNEHRFNHNFEDYINPLCSCSLEVESTAHFFLHCYNLEKNNGNTLLNKLNSISCEITICSERSLTELILYGNPKFSFQQNPDIINASIEYIINSKMFAFVIKLCIPKTKR